MRLGLVWYAARLRAMPAREIAYRAGQALRTRRRRLQAALGRTPAPSVVPAPAGPPHVVRFFEVELAFPSAEPIDWSRDYRSGVSAPRVFYGDIDYRDESQVGDSKYTWELNRHQFLAPWALEYRRTGDEAHAAAVVRLVLEWITENPRYVGINWSSALEMALRILSWGIALDLCRDSKHAAAARPAVAASVAEQAGFIRETLSRHSSANNHLMGELVGLLAAGAFFPEAPRSLGHAALARDEILGEAFRQNFGDGVNREQAIYYHHYTLEYVMTATCLFERLGWEAPPSLLALVRRMLEFVDSMTDDTGEAFEIGDRDDGAVTGLNLGTGVGVYESLLWAGWAVFGDEALGAHAARIARSRGAAPEVDRRTAYWHPGARPPTGLPLDTTRPRCFFPQGGYFVSGDGEWTLLFKAGPFGYPSIAAHAHCDQLGIGLKRGASTVLTDAGTYVYHTQDRWRRFFRGTSAHNTVRVDRVDQAEYSGPFLWSTHADGELEVLEDASDRFEVRGTHDGYRRLADPVAHERRVSYRRGAGYRIVDRLAGSRTHLYELFWNFGCGVTLQPIEPGGTVSSEGAFRAAWTVRLAGDPVLGLVLTSETPCTLESHHGDETIPAGFESRRYLERKPIHRLRLAATGPRCELRSFLLPLHGGVPGEAVVLSAPERWS